MNAAIRFVVLLTLAVADADAAAMPQHEQHAGGASKTAGSVHFATSCQPAVANDFDRAVALLHSFWFSAAIDAFHDVLAKDPTCAMAQWGIAMSRWGNPFGGYRSAAALEQGRQAAERAQALGPPTPRERDYIAAVTLLYKDAATIGQRARTVAYERTMEQLAGHHPEDPEARIFYALALEQTAPPADKTYANQLRATALLEEELARQPNHPGIAHYLIHGYDAPALAGRGLAAATKYASLAPAAPHALHMPSHTFTRVGLWQASIDTNRASAAAARKDRSPAVELHALDYLVYAALQSGQDGLVARLLPSIPTLVAQIEVDDPGAPTPPTTGFFGGAAIPARYALERNAWAEAAALQPTASPFPWTEAMTYFARGLGAVRTGNREAASAAADRLAAYRDQLQTRSEAYDWAGQVEIQRRAIAAGVARLDGRAEEALVLLREAADLEDATEKATVTPGPLKPARELLAEMLLEQDRPQEALKEFEATLRIEPNRFRALYGAAKAAERSGDAARARDYYRTLLEVCTRADASGRPELDEARRVAGRGKPGR